MQSKRDRYAPALFGRRLPLYCTAGGKAIMSYMSPSEVGAVLKDSNVEARTRNTIVEKSKLLAQLKKARDNGYAYQREEVRHGALAVGAAVLDRSGVPIGAIHIAGSTSNWDGDEFREKMGALIASVASEINSP
jgi:DNA-binding IclR family transcriptional regulator